MGSRLVGGGDIVSLRVRVIRVDTLCVTVSVDHKVKACVGGRLVTLVLRFCALTLTPTVLGVGAR
jgi:hypothetical protein